MDLLHKKIEFKFNLILDNILDIHKPKVMDLYNEYIIIYTEQVLNNGNVHTLVEQTICENIIDKLDSYAKEYILKQHILNDYLSNLIQINLQPIKVKFCHTCQAEMISTYDGKYFECNDCYILEEKTSNYTEKSLPRSRIGNFNPERHFKTWIDRILARESEDEIKTPDDPTSEKLIECIKNNLKSKRKSIEHLTVDDIRVVLKETGNTHLNRNTSLIAKKITGRSPPKLDDNKYMKIYTLFLQVMEARDEIPNSSRCNRIYYPYYISKILSLILETPEERKILNYVHLHKESTLSTNDAEWQKICEILPSLYNKYEPTINSHNRYI